MAINYTRLFTTLGKIVGGLNEVNTYRGTTLTARVTTLSTRFDAALQQVAEGLYPARDSAQTDMDSWVSYLQGLAENTILQEVDADRKLVNLTLSDAILELDRQMQISAQSLEDSDAAIAITPTLVDGTALVVGTTLQPAGVAAQLALADTILISVPRGYLGGDTQFQEFLALEGTRDAVPATSHLWPQGSGVKTSLQVRDAHYNIGLSNGRLSSLTDWTSTGGTWTVGAATLAPRVGYTADVTKFAPSGASGTHSQVVTLQANTVYTWTLKVYKHSGTQDWSVGVRLKDGAGTTIPGLTSTHTAASLTGSAWNTLSGFFVTPKAWDGDASFEVFYSSIVTQSNLEVAHAGLDITEPLYRGGPTIAAWAGTEPITVRDKWSAAVTVGGTGALHRGIDRLVDLKSVLPHGLPVNVAHTQADALVS